jgi:hypothetical protein
MFLETRDGVAILGYAGLGATAKGTEPATWMSAVLRGKNFTLEASLDALADAVRRQIPRHLQHVPASMVAAHSIIVPAFLNGHIRFYSIDMILSPDRRSHRLRGTRHVVANHEGVPTGRTPRLGLAGSGARYLIKQKGWARELLRLVRACDRGLVSQETVADYLAEINSRVHRLATDGTVGPRCIVAWRNRKSSIHRIGGAQRCYSGTALDRGCPSIPTIANGMDVAAIAAVMMNHLAKNLPNRAADSTALVQMDFGSVAQEVSKIPDTSDEDLS